MVVLKDVEFGWNGKGYVAPLVPVDPDSVWLKECQENKYYLYILWWLLDGAKYVPYEACLEPYRRVQSLPVVETMWPEGFSVQELYQRLLNGVYDLPLVVKLGKSELLEQVDSQGLLDRMVELVQVANWGGYQAAFMKAVEDALPPT